jgi:GntP family gluconate:H+ symporter
MLIVIAGVLVLRLHAFVALLLAALTVAALTSPDQVKAARLAAASVPVVTVAADGQWSVRPGKGREVIAGTNYLIANGKICESPVEVVLPSEPKGKGPLRVVQVAGPLPEGIDPAHAALVHATLLKQAGQEAHVSAGERVAGGFGRTATSVGILIALAAIIGECLMASGAADRIVWSIRRLLGDDRAPQGFVLSGFVLCIPMFFDTVFYLLLPVARALRRRTGRHWVLYVLSVVAGATMAHSLVPPTPGPLAIIAELNVNMGTMMLGGGIVGLVAASAGYAYAVWADRRWDVPLPVEDAVPAAEAGREIDPATLPSLSLSLAPILLPVLLIAGTALLDLYPADAQPVWAGWLRFWGDKNLALGVSALFALGLLWWHKRDELKELNRLTQHALGSAGVIILIIAAGGAFGSALQQTGIASELAAMMPASKHALLPVAFLITATIRIAQGSATVAMITAVGIVAPLALGGDLGYHPVYVALAIGCGSKPIPWMNDSGFWIISRMSGFSELQTLRTASAMMSLMGVAGLVVTMLGAWLLPLV